MWREQHGIHSDERGEWTGCDRVQFLGAECVCTGLSVLSAGTFYGNRGGMETDTGEFCPSGFTRIYDRKTVEQLQNQSINDLVQVANLAVKTAVCYCEDKADSWLENSRRSAFFE